MKKNNKSLILKLPLTDWVAVLLSILFSTVGSIVSVHRYWQYDVYHYDFGIFDQALWNASRLHAPIIEHLVVGGKWIFADHFNPSLFMLAPLYWLTDRQEVMLIAQATFVGFTGFIIYLIGKKIIQHNLLALAVLIMYFLFVGVQNAVITDIHEVTFSVLFIALSYWAALNKKVKLFFLFFILMLGFKESTFLIGIGIAISLFFINKDWRKISIAAGIISVMWGIVSIKFAIPFFSGGMYGYSPSIPDSWNDRVFFLINHPIKVNTLFATFGSFAFLPFLTPEFWTVFAQDFLQRFLPANTLTRYGVGLHYSAQIATVSAIASCFAITRLIHFKFLRSHKRSLVFLLIGNALFFYHFVTRAPFALVYNPAFYAHTQNFAFLDELVSQVPASGSVMTQNNLAPRFSHRKLYLLRTNYKDFMPDFIVVDARDGQGPNNFFGTDDLKTVLEGLKSDRNYKVRYHNGDQYIFEKVDKPMQ